MNVQGIMVSLSLITAFAGCAGDEPFDSESDERSDAPDGYSPPPPPPPREIRGSTTEVIFCTKSCDFEVRYHARGRDFTQEQEVLAVQLISNDTYRIEELLLMGDGSKEGFAEPFGESTLWELAYIDMAPGTYRVEVASRLAALEVHVEIDVMDTIRDEWPHIGEACTFSVCGGDTTCMKMPINIGNFWSCTAPCITDAQCPDSNCQDIPNGEGSFDSVCAGEWLQD